MIRVESPGALTTVQDLGRPGFGPLGVSPAGAADPVALRVANLLTGNAPGAPALEMTLRGGTFRFGVSATISLGGSDFGASVEGVALAPWCSCEIRAGASVRVGMTRSGARCYLAVRGGIGVEARLGSASTHLASGLGGFHGRALRKGDVLPIGGAAQAQPRIAVRPGALAALAPRKQLRVTWGPEHAFFISDARRQLVSADFTVTEEADRTGLRLAGPALAAPSREMITQGVPLGAIQVPPGGQPIILFIDQQTTGGYPVIASVIAADLASLGQLRPRDEIRFEPVSFEAARRLVREQEALLASEDLFE